MIRLIAAALVLAIVLPLTACTSAPVDPVQAAIAAFAQGGVAVMEDVTSTQPIRKLEGPPSAMQFTRWQVQNLVGEVQAQNGHTADDLDGLVPAPAGMPRLSQLLAAWLTRDQGALAQWAHEQYTKADFSKPDTLTYPTVVVALFIADIARPTTAALAPHPSFDWERFVAAPAEADGICSDVAGWVGNVANRVLSAVQSNGNSFLSTFWNTVVAVVGIAVNAVVTNILPTLLAYVTKIATIAATLIQVTSLLKPWTVKLVADPGAITLSDAPTSGTFTATLDAKAIHWPQSLIDCVAAISPGTNLEAAPYKDAPITWSNKVGIPAVATETSSDSSLKDDETAAYSVTTIISAKPPEEQCPVLFPEGKIGVTVTVARNDINNVVNSLEQLLLGDIPSTLRSYLQQYIQPALDSAADKAKSKFSSPTATASIAVSRYGVDTACNHTPPPQPTPQPTTTSLRQTGSLARLPCSQVVLDGDVAQAFPGNKLVELPQKDKDAITGLLNLGASDITDPSDKASITTASICILGKQDGTEPDDNGNPEPSYAGVAFVIAADGQDAPVDSEPECVTALGRLLTSTDAICSGGGGLWQVYDKNATYSVRAINPSANSGTLDMLKRVLTQVENR